MKQVARIQTGFTLIELMIVVAIIGVLASIAFSAYVDAQQKAANKSAQADAKNAVTAFQAASVN